MLPDIAARQITQWAGTIVSIPAGWSLCDGTNGTPDLRNKFIVGSGSSYAQNDTGGSTPHTHTFTATGHMHDEGLNPALGAGAGFEYPNETQPIAGTTNGKSNLPTYYSLAYIMKL